MPGGIVVRPPQRSQDEVARRWPTFPLDRFNMFASMYFTDLEHKATPNSDVRKRMARLVDKSLELYVELGTLSEEESNALADVGDKINFVVGSLEIELKKLQFAAMRAEDALSGLTGGRPRSALSKLVSRLVGTMEGLGLPVNATPNGMLVSLCEIIMDGYAIEKPTAARKAVERYLDKTL